jgi:type IV pilus assembly protein PilE
MRSYKTQRGSHQRGFTLIEMMITVVIIAILAALALPNYREHIKRGNREAAQAHLVEMAGVQEKIYLNSNAYTDSVTAAYTGASTGGLGVTSGLTRDGRYSLASAVDGASFTLTATPVAGLTQDGDGALSINSQGQRLWGAKAW